MRNKSIDKIEDLEKRDLLNKMTIFFATREYIEDKDTIAGVIKKLNDAIIDEDKVKKDYQHQVSYILDKIELLSMTLRMKKIEKNRKDGQILIQEMLKQVNKLIDLVG
jgi:hypothetical protein